MEVLAIIGIWFGVLALWYAMEIMIITAIVSKGIKNGKKND